VLLPGGDLRLFWFDWVYGLAFPLKPKEGLNGAPRSFRTDLDNNKERRVMNDPRRYYARLMWCLLVLFPVGLAISVFAIQQNKISLQGFREMILLLVGGFIAACAILITKIRRLPLAAETTERVGNVQSTWTKVKMWNLRVVIALLVFSLFFGNWIERDGPLMPRIIGTLANLAWTWLLVKHLRWLQTNGK
jgi:hypothetical protein